MPRLIQLCRDKRERSNSDAVLVACLVSPSYVCVYVSSMYSVHVLCVYFMIYHYQHKSSQILFREHVQPFFDWAAMLATLNLIVHGSEEII